MDIEFLSHEISKKFDIPYDNLYCFINQILRQNTNSNNNNDENINKDIILPFCGFICDNKCKAVVYNHGLYTQCTKDIKNGADICKSCSKLKYGRIEDRQNFPLGEFKTSEGKLENDYLKFVKKMGYNIDDVKKSFEINNLNHPCIKYLETKKTKGRGRPKKEIKTVDIELNEESEEEIDVTLITIDGVEYYKTNESVILSKNDNKIMGILVNGVICNIEN